MNQDPASHQNANEVPFTEDWAEPVSTPVDERPLEGPQTLAETTTIIDGNGQSAELPDLTAEHGRDVAKLALDMGGKACFGAVSIDERISQLQDKTDIADERTFDIALDKALLQHGTVVVVNTVDY